MDEAGIYTMYVEPASIKICTDCIYYHPITCGVRSEGECHHENALNTISRVDGYHIYYNCEFMRGSRDRCGPEGKLFEHKKVLEASEGWRAKGFANYKAAKGKKKKWWEHILYFLGAGGE